MNQRPTNPGCRKLAEQLYPRDSPIALNELANRFQDVADDFHYQSRARQPTVANGRDGNARSSLEAGAIDALFRLRERVQRAETAYARALVEVFPVNTRAVYLWQGTHPIACTVLGHRGDRVKVRSSSCVERYVLGDLLRPADKASG